MNWIRNSSMVLGVAIAIAAAPALSQDFPTRPLRLLVPFAPGGNTDILARAVGPRMAEKWGRPVVVDNRPGGAGLIACETVARATPDGHTLLVGSTGELAVNPSLFRKLPYDVNRDFAPITLGTVSPLLLVRHPSLPVRSVKDFDTSIWFAFFAPAKTPRKVIEALNAELVRVLKLPEVNQFLVNTGVEVAPGSPADLARFVRSETEKYRKIIKVSATELQ